MSDRIFTVPGIVSGIDLNTTDQRYEVSGTSNALAATLSGLYQSSGLYEVSGTSYTKAESTARYEVSGTSEALNAGLPARFQTSGLYETSGTSYTKDESDVRYAFSGISGGSTTLSGLTDVILNAIASGELLLYDGAVWRNSTVSGSTTPHTLDDLTDVAVVGATVNQMLKFDGVNWVPSLVDPSLFKGSGLFIDTNSKLSVGAGFGIVSAASSVGVIPGTFALSGAYITSSGNWEISGTSQTLNAGLPARFLASGVYNTAAISDTRYAISGNLPAAYLASGLYNSASISDTRYALSGNLAAAYALSGHTHPDVDIVYETSGTSQALNAGLPGRFLASGLYNSAAISDTRYALSGNLAAAYALSGHTHPDVDIVYETSGTSETLNAGLPARFLASGLYNSAAISDTRYALSGQLASTYQQSGLYELSGTSYTKAESDVRYALSGSTGVASSGSWEISGTSAALNAGLPARFLASGLYELSGTSYTKAEEDARYVNIVGDAMTGSLYATAFHTSGAVVAGGGTDVFGNLTAIGGTSFAGVPAYGIASLGRITQSSSTWDGCGFVFANSSIGSAAFTMVMNADKAWFGFLNPSGPGALKPPEIIEPLGLIIE